MYLILVLTFILLHKSPFERTPKRSSFRENNNK